MFTGIVQDIGVLLRKTPHGSGARLVISTALPLDEVSPGDSVAVCGACLTVIRVGAGTMEADISRETAARSTLYDARPGEKLHLERALRLADRLDGHLVLGHVDGIGSILRRQEQGDSLSLEISAPEEIRPYLVTKGSIAVHGVSLTINSVLPEAFGVTLVPYTETRTFLGELEPGSQVNLEADLLGKFVERLLERRGRARESQGLTLEHLALAGFLE